MNTALQMPQFLAEKGTLFDVRSPQEYLHSRIPGAVSLPLFTDAERAAVGTVYKQQGQREAIDLGLELVGPKLSAFVRTARNHTLDHSAQIYCWRGGMRSSSMAWLLRTAGFQVVTLKGGYKAFRNWVLKVLREPRPLIVLGGLTGCGKTAILRALKVRGQQVIDLEGLANHRGSSFGALGPQQSSEHFENEIAVQWASLDPLKPTWIEDESRLIGACKIPDPLFKLIQQSPLVYIEKPLQKRVQFLTEEYGSAPSEDLIIAIKKLTKKLGFVRTQAIIQLIHSGNLTDAILETLKYYDAAYQYSLKRKAPVWHSLTDEGLSSDEWAIKLLTWM